MQEITFEIDAQRVGRASGYLGGLTIERYTFTGATIPAGTRLAILTRAGVTIAAAEITEGNAATVDTNTQEVADLLRYQPLGACENVYITLGDADNILAIIPATMRKNWLDDEAAHPPVPANRYPTKTELDQWLARFDERAAQTAADKSASEAAATAARNSATEAAQSARAAGDSAVDAEDSATAAEGSKRAAETAQRAAEAAQGTAQSAATSAGESAKIASASEQAALTAKQSAETAQTQAQASETAAKASEASAKASETAASASEEEARVSEQAAAESETAAAASANAAKASETAASSNATAAEAAKAGAEAAKTAAETAKASADSAKAAAASSATAAANSASAAAQSATEAASQVTDTLKRLTFAGGRFYSKYFNANTASITFDTSKAPGDHALMAWNDRYLVLSTSLQGGWFTMLGNGLSFIASAPYHYNYYIYNHALFYQVGFNGERVAIFYRFNEYNADKGICNYAEVLDANTGEVLIEKTYTDEEMAFIKAAPCWGIEFTCILKNGDMLHRGTIFSGEDLSIKGYVATEDGFAFYKSKYSTYCCYLTANADNNYSGEDPIIVQSNDDYSFWVDDRYTLDESGNPIVTLRNFLIDGIYDENNVETRRNVGVLFSTCSGGWGNIYHRAIVYSFLYTKNTISMYTPSLDETRENRIVFTLVKEISRLNYPASSPINFNQFIPTNYYTPGLIYRPYSFYLQQGELVYTVGNNGSVAFNPAIVFCGNKRIIRTEGVYFLPSVTFLSGYAAPQRLIPCDRHSNNGSSFIYPVENT